MTDELKPVRCGCGGETVVHEQEYGKYEVYCPRCFITTDDYKTEAEAVTAWNKAMGERTAKVEKIHMEYASEGDFDIYECGDCGNCGETVMRGDKFCHECGARLEWE